MGQTKWVSETLSPDDGNIQIPKRCSLFFFNITNFENLWCKAFSEQMIVSQLVMKNPMILLYPHDR
jgi:hypothetical protein